MSKEFVLKAVKEVILSIKKNLKKAPNGLIQLKNKFEKPTVTYTST